MLFLYFIFSATVFVSGIDSIKKGLKVFSQVNSKFSLFDQSHHKMSNTQSIASDIKWLIIIQKWVIILKTYVFAEKLSFFIFLPTSKLVLKKMIWRINLEELTRRFFTKNANSVKIGKVGKLPDLPTDHFYGTYSYRTKYYMVINLFYQA